MTAENSPNLDLPYILPAQAQKHVTHNEALRALDALTQLSVLDSALATPPATPADGDRYIVPAAPTGAWVGHAGKLAAFQDGAWAFFTPREGWTAWVAATDKRLIHDGANWVLLGGLPANLAPMLGVNTTADASNRLAVKSNAVLLSHDDLTPGSGDMRLTLNKALAGNATSLLFQTGYSGRVEVGTTGDDKLHLKVSADGASWTEAAVFDSSGRVGLGTANPINKLDVVGTLGTTSISQDGTTISFSRNNFNYISAVAGASASLRLTAGNVIALSTTTAGTERLRVTSAGDVGVATTAPTCKLHVAGPIRCQSYTVATVPSAVATGAGTMIYVSNPASGGARPYWSNGAGWYDAAGILLA